MAFPHSLWSSKPKWSRDQITALIDAFKQEPCLYAIGNPNYHNKQVRASALQRVCAVLRVLRPETHMKECQTKFNNLRTQFNIENAKVKKSLKNGGGTADVYQPSLWYFDKIRFVEDHFVPRKNPPLRPKMKQVPIRPLPTAIPIIEEKVTLVKEDAAVLPSPEASNTFHTVFSLPLTMSTCPQPTYCNSSSSEPEPSTGGLEENCTEPPPSSSFYWKRRTELEEAEHSSRMEVLRKEMKMRDLDIERKQIELEIKYTELLLLQKKLKE